MGVWVGVLHTRMESGIPRGAVLLTRVESGIPRGAVLLTRVGDRRPSGFRYPCRDRRPRLSLNVPLCTAERILLFRGILPFCLS